MTDETPNEQPRNPLHGLTLEAIVTALADHYGWEDLGQRIPVRCFNVDPSVGSSLRFLRKTPWAREKVEGLYLFMRREQARAAVAALPGVTQVDIQMTSQVRAAGRPEARGDWRGDRRRASRLPG